MLPQLGGKRCKRAALERVSRDDDCLVGCDEDEKMTVGLPELGDAGPCQIAGSAREGHGQPGLPYAQRVLSVDGWCLFLGYGEAHRQEIVTCAAPRHVADGENEPSDNEEGSDG